MAVSVDQRLAFELWRAIAGLLHQEFAQQEGLTSELLSVLVARQQIGHLVAKDVDAARFQPNERRFCCDLLTQGFENLLQLISRGIQHAEVVQRTPAAQRRCGNDHLIAGMLQNLDGGLSDLGMKVIAEGIWPQHDLRLALILRRALAEPVSERLPGELGHASLRGNAAEELNRAGKSRSPADKVHQAGRKAGEPGPAVDHPHGKSRTWPPPAVIIMSK